MDKSIGDVFYIAVSLLVSSVLLSVVFLFSAHTNSPQRISTGCKNAEIKELEIKAFHYELEQSRYRSKYEGQKTGANVVDFISTHYVNFPFLFVDIVIHHLAFLCNFSFSDTL